MNPYVLTYIQRLLKEEESINDQFFLGCNEDENTINIIENIQKYHDEITEEIYNIDLNETAYTEDSFNDIEEMNFEKIEDILSHDFARLAHESISDNFFFIEDLLNEYEIEIPKELVNEKDNILNNLLNDSEFNKLSTEYYSIINELEEIKNKTSEAYSEKDILMGKINELEESEKNIEFIEENEQEFELENYEEILDTARTEHEDLEKEIESFKNDLKDYYSSIDWTLDKIKRTVDENNYINELIKKIEEYNDNVYYELLEKLGEKEPELLLNESERFMKSNNSIESFFKNKEGIDVWEHFILSKNEEIQEAKIFRDKSIALKTKSGWKSIKEGSYSYFRASMDLSKSMISHKFRKKQKYKEMFLKSFFKDNNLDTTLDTIDYFFKLEPVLKNKNFDLNKFKNKKSEYIYDELMEIEKEHKIEQYSKKLLSNKYKHFITQESLKLFKEIVELDIPKSHVQDNIGKKLAVYKSQEEFEKSLRNYINSINEFDIESVKVKSENKNAEIILEEKDLLILKIKDFDASKSLGAGTSWCISRTESFFNSYVKTNKNHQYFVYDFNKNSKDRDSRIGITIKPNGAHRAAHYKNDSNASIEEIFDLKKKILKNDLEIQKTLSIENKKLFKVIEEPELNWANEDNSKRNYNYKSNNLVMLEVKIEDVMKNTFNSQRLDLNDLNGGSNAKIERITKAKEHFLKGEPMDLPEVGCNDSGTAIGFTDGRHRTLVAYQLGAEFIPMFVEKENLENFKKMVETREVEPKLNDKKQNKLKLK